MRIILALSNQTKESNLLYHQAMPGKLHIDIVYPGHLLSKQSKQYCTLLSWITDLARIILDINMLWIGSLVLDNFSSSVVITLISNSFTQSLTLNDLSSTIIAWRKLGVSANAILRVYKCHFISLLWDGYKTIGNRAPEGQFKTTEYVTWHCWR